MSPLWDENLRTGYKELDDQHRKAFALMAEVNDALKQHQPKEVLTEILGRLLDYFERHTQTEEAIMRAFDFDGLAAHKLEHDSILKEIRSTMASFAKDGLNALITVKLQTMLTRWSREHIANHDQTMVDFLFEAMGAPKQED